MKLSKAGGIGAGLFLGLYLLTLLWLTYSAATNPADSGEGGILLFGFAFPWILAVQPGNWGGAGLLFGLTLLNALTIYLAIAAAEFGARWLWDRAKGKSVR